MTTWEEKFIRFMAERWVFMDSDPHDFKPRVLFLAYGEDFLSPLLAKHRHFGALYSGYLGGRLVGYMRVPPGTVILEGIMRSLMFTRVETVIGLGTCGALQPEIDCGDIIVGDSSQAGDCLSMHYGYEYLDVIDADTELSNSLARSLKGKNLAVYDGPIVTTGAVFRETRDLVTSWSDAGFLGVELEASSQFAVANYMGLKSTIALMVTDSPIRNQLCDNLRGAERDAFVNGIIDFIEQGTFM